MITRDTVHKILDIKESYQMPDKLMELLQSEESKEKIFDEFMEIEQDLSYDWFTDYFQDEQGDRKQLKQDFTPDCICTIVNGIIDNSDEVADICAGTGGLTIKRWQQDKSSYFYCEEVSSRTIPILLFNMAIRNATGCIVHGDSLKNKVEAVYYLWRGNKYSSIEKSKAPPVMKFKAVIMNPPYSLTWDGEVSEDDARFEGYAMPPKSKADYAFVLHGLHMLEEGGTLVAVLPHGVLFRGNAEEEIRKRLVQKKYIDGIIGLPDKLFLNTGIPVLLLVIKKCIHEDICIIDASKEYIKGSKQNSMSEDNIKTVLSAYNLRRSIDKMSSIVKSQEVEENGYNLNIPRYVDTFEAEPVPDIQDIIAEMIETEKEIARCETELLHVMQNELVGTTEQAQKELEKAVRLYQGYMQEKRK